MSLERRLLLLLLLCAPLVWTLGLGIAINRAQHDVNGLFDTEMIRLAQQVAATLEPREGVPALASPPGSAAVASVPATRPDGPNGDADQRELAIAVWDAAGILQVSDREGVLLPHSNQVLGFQDVELAKAAWRVYYLRSFDGRWLVAAGQKAEERNQLVLSLTLGQLLPWLMLLPVLLAVMAWAVRRALLPVRRLTAELSSRSADELQAVPVDHAPTELRPMLAAMNGLFARIQAAIARERRFTSDAAHELRTPLAVLRAQWDVVRRSANADDRVRAEAKFGAGLDRIDRLVAQMLALSRLEDSIVSRAGVDIDWMPIVEQAVSDCLPLAERRRIELACEGPMDGELALPLQGDAALLTVMLRNLIDNAARYAPIGSTVQLRLSSSRIVVENDGAPLAEDHLARLGERFYRPDGQDEAGSGLGVSIVQRIAALHGLVVGFVRLDHGRGVRVEIARLPTPTVTAAVSARPG